VNGRVMNFRGTYCNAQYWYLLLFFYFLDIYFANVVVPFQTPPPFVMTQINEIK